MAKEQLSGFAKTVFEPYITVFAVFIFVAILLFLLRFQIKRLNPLKIESNSQSIIELIFGFFEGLVESMVSKKYVAKLTPLAITIFLTIALTNVIGLIGLSEGARFNPIYTLTWSFFLFFVWTAYGIYVVGFKHYTKELATPFWMLPLELVGNFAKPISMGFRLFGNISAGAIIMLGFWMIPNYLINMDIVLNLGNGPLLLFISGAVNVVIAATFAFMGSFLSIYFSLFSPLIQAFVFTVLTLVNIGMIVNTIDQK